MDWHELLRMWGAKYCGRRGATDLITRCLGGVT